VISLLISLIAAMDHNRVIGKNNDIPWRLPKEWEYIKKITMGHPIILGRKNFESIGRALPGRRNIILTRDKGYSAEDCEVSVEKGTTDEKNPYIYYFHVYERID
jgi:dihydrofolate reductase (trimethoprim resistance protein)